MSSFLATRSARRRSLTFMVLLATTLVLMAFSSNPVVRDLQSGLGAVLRPIQGALDGLAGSAASIGSAIGGIDQLRLDTASLREENARLTAENARLQEIRRQNDQLSALLKLQNGFEHQTVAASVIMRESSEFRRVVGLGKGSNDGIAVGDVVVAAGGALAGRVTEVGPDSATVVLVTDGSSTVIGQLVTSAATGKVVGQLGGPLIMDQVDAGQTISLGEAVVTAGIQLGQGVRSPYPKGLLIGRVVDVRRDANDVVQTAYLQPSADLDRLENVLVIVDYAGGLPPIEQQPVDCGPTPRGSARPGTLPEGEQPCFDPTPSRDPTPSPDPSVSSEVSPRSSSPKPTP